MKYKLNKAHLPLILAFALPIAMILLVALSIYIPRFLVRPQYDFLYTLGPYSYGQSLYKVIGNKLIRKEYHPNESAREKVRLLRYSVATQASSEISFGEAQSYSLINSITSPDGFEITTGSGHGSGLFPLFFYEGSDYNARYLKKGSVSKKIDIPETQPYTSEFNFIGWIQ